VDSSEIGDQFGNRFGIDLKVVPAAPVWGLSRSTLPQQRQKVSIGAALAGSMVESLIILNPEGNVPGFPVCPPVVGFGLSSGGGRHRVGFVWFLRILQATPPPRGGRCASCSTVLGFLLGGIRCDRLQDLQEFLTIRGTIQQSRCNFESHDKM